MHRHEAADHTFELVLELLFARVDHDLGALPKNEFLDFQEAPQVALIDLFGIHLEDLPLIEEDHFIDGGFAFAHVCRDNTCVRKGAHHNRQAR
ncbi:hypothetical protein D3C78_1446700 [compost metagenome]